jgi:excisionase family DNA binding protein
MPLASQDVVDKKILLRPGEVADTLSVGRATVYQMISARILPTVRIGRAVRVPSRALQLWVEEQQKKNEGR